MTDRYKTTKYVKLFAVLFVVFLLLGYTGYEIQKVIFGPRIHIDYPQNGALVSDSLLEVKGVAQNINDISLNDRKIFIDEKGNFDEEVLLQYGYNALVLKAVDKFGRQTEKILEIIYK